MIEIIAIFLVIILLHIIALTCAWNMTKPIRLKNSLQFVGSKRKEAK